MYRVACLDVYDDEVFSRILSQVPEGFELVRAESYESEAQAKAAKNADFILTGWAPVPACLIEHNSNLKLIQKFGVGYDKIDIKVAGELGIPVAIAFGSNAHPVAELAVGLMIAVLRHLHYAMNELRNGNFIKSELRAVSYQLKDKTVGLIGLGNVGKEVAYLVRAFGARPIYYDVRNFSLDEDGKFGAENRSLDGLLADSDIVSLHLPLSPDTKHFMNRERIGQMKPKAVLINTARGELIDEVALAEAINQRRLLGAGLDVTEHEPIDPFSPLLQSPRVLITPHVGGSVVDNVSNVAIHAFENMRRILSGEALPAADLVNSQWLKV